MPCPDLGALRASIDDGGAPAPVLEHARGCAALLRHPDRAPAQRRAGRPDDRPDRSRRPAGRRRGRGRPDLAGTAGRGWPPPGRSRSARPWPRPPPGRPWPPGCHRTPKRPRPGPAGPAWPAGRAGGLDPWVAAALVAALVLTGLVATPGGRGRRRRLRPVPQPAVRGRPARPRPGDPGRGRRGRPGEDGRVHRRRHQDGRLRRAGGGRRPGRGGRMAGFCVPAVDPSALPAGVARTYGSWSPGPRSPASPSTATGPSTTCAATAAPAPACPSGTTAPGWSSRSRRWSCNSSRAATAGRRCWSARPGRSAWSTEGGASLAELREVLLDLPGLPAETADRLRRRRRLARHPAPAGPSDEVRWRPATVGGAEALSFADRTAGSTPCSGSATGTSGGGQRARGVTRPAMSRTAPLTRRRPPGPPPRSRRSPRPACARPSGPGSPCTTWPCGSSPGRCSGSSAPTGPARRTPP